MASGDVVEGGKNRAKTTTTKKTLLSAWVEWRGKIFGKKISSLEKPLAF
jgi:hypothetical protein